MDKRKKKSQAAIFSALFTLLQEKEFERLTINEIAQVADLSRNTVYSNFDDKFHILKEFNGLYLTELLSICSQVSLDESHYFEKIIGLMFQYLEKNQLIYRQLFNKAIFFDFRQDFSTMLKLAFTEANKLNPRPETELTIEFLSSGITGILAWWLATENTLSASEATKQLQDLMSQSRLLVPFNH